MGIASDVQICNNALARIGNNPIASLNEASTAGKACKNLYDPTRRLLLRQFLWNFAVKRVALAASVTAPAFEYNVQYTLPSDFIRMVSIFNRQSPYKIEGTSILTDDSAPLQVKYIYDVQDTTLFDDLFVEALTIFLAIKLGTRITGSGFNPGTMVKELDEALSTAKLVDSQDQTPDDLIIDEYKSGMYGGIGVGFDPMKQGF